MKEIDNLLNQFAKLYQDTVILFTRSYPNSQGKDTLRNSDIVRDMKVSVEDGKLTIGLYDYFVYIENGRKAGARKVPIDVLIEWIKRKRIQGRDRMTGRFISVNSLAFIIQRSIYKKGIKQRPIFSDAFEHSYEIFDQNMNEVISDILDNILLEFTQKNK